MSEVPPTSEGPIYNSNNGVVNYGKGYYLGDVISYGAVSLSLGAVDVEEIYLAPIGGPHWSADWITNDEEYKKLIYSYLTHDLKVEYQYWMCEQQMTKMVKEGRTLRGILFALKYFYGIRHGDWLKGHGGLGIIPFVYDEAAQYWTNREAREQGIIEGIERQMREAAKQHKTVVAQKKVTRRKKINFSLDEEEEDDEC